MVFRTFALPQRYYRIFTHRECYTLNKKRMWFSSLLYQIFTHYSQRISWDCSLFKAVQTKQKRIETPDLRSKNVKVQRWEEHPQISSAPEALMGWKLMIKQYETSWEVQICCQEKPHTVKWTCMVKRKGRKRRWRDGVVNVKPVLTLRSSDY